MSAKLWGVVIIFVAGAALCFGLWRHGTVAKGTAYRVMSGTDEIYAYRFEVREHLAVGFAMRHPVAAKRARGQAYAAVSGVIGCLPSEPTRASVGPVEAHLARTAQLPIVLSVLSVNSLGWVESGSGDASSLRSDCQALQNLDPTDLSVPAAPS